MMSKYIDADVLKDKMFNYYDCVNLNTRKDNYNGETLMNYEVADMIENCIDNAPTADVEEVRHAKWVHYGEDIQCSNCGHVSDDICYEGDMDSGYYTVLPRYCSNCGAKMDLED